jgi:hypothetical protein
VRERLRQLAAESGIQLHSANESDEIRASGWVLSEGSSEGLKPRFELLATTAGLALGASLSRNVQPVEYWLDHLWLDLLENGSNYVFGNSITDVYRASEICCLRLAKAAEEKEALERGEIEASPVVDRAAIARDAVGHPAVGQIIDEGGNHERPSSSPTVLHANTAQKENSEAPKGPDFSTIESRKRAVSEYTSRWSTAEWTCTVGTLADTAGVDRADLYRWIRGTPRAKNFSTISKRIVRVLTTNQRPKRLRI